MEREQIIKALECCTRGRKSNEDIPCLECPYNECNIVGGTSERQTSGTCQGWLMKDALALIKELTEKVEAYRQELGKVRVALNNANVDNKRLTEENERWRAECENQSVLWRQHFESVYQTTKETIKETIKSNTVREFAERLKYTLCINNEENTEFFDYSYTLETIDEVANKILNKNTEE